MKYNKIRAITPRQVQAIRLLCAGRSQKQIADEMGCSIKTVGHHFDHAYLRTGARGRVMLALWAVRNGIVRL